MDTETVGKGEGDVQEAKTRQAYYDTLLGHYSSHSLSFFSFSFFLVPYCRVECNFLTLKISSWGAPTFRRQTGAEVDASALRVG